MRTDLSPAGKQGPKYPNFIISFSYFLRNSLFPSTADAEMRSVI